MHKKLNIIIVILLCLLLLPLNAFAQSWAKVGESGNFNGDINIPSGCKYYINGVALAVGDITGAAASGVNSDITELTGLTTPLGPAYGGTGVANAAGETITLSGDDAITFTTTAATNVTLPTTGTLATLAGDEVFTNKDFNFYHVLGSDHLYSGETDSQPVGETVAYGDILHLDWTTKEWWKAQADTYATARGTRIALETKNDGETCLMLVKGYIRDDSAFDFGAVPIFLNDDTAGACDDTAPAESGDQIFMVGEAKSADILFFNPAQDIGEVK